jgi:hypothetical protein
MQNLRQVLSWRSTLTTSSTFPQFDSKMWPNDTKIRKLQ